jgi:acyl-coenzyme A thioesterase PaaI-like protein
MTLAATADELRDLLSRAVFVREYGFALESFADGECTIRAPFHPGLERPGGVIGGPAFMAAADVTMWLAIITRLGPADRSVTVALHTAFLAAARREDFRCTARVVRWGRRLVHGVAECVGADGRLLTHSTVTYMRPQ